MSKSRKIKPTRKCKNWIANFSGMQGGNPKAQLWFCGLEYQGDDDLENTIKTYSNKWSIESPPNWEKDINELKEKKKKEDIKEKFNQQILNLATAYYNLTDSSKNIDKEDRKKLIEDNLFSEKGYLFKLNLYPIPQSRTGEVYDKKYANITKICTKSELRSICLEEKNRFANFKALLDLHQESVKAIICSSRSSWDTFLLAFAGHDFTENSEFYRLKDELEKEGADKEITAGSKKYYSTVQLQNKVHLFIVPFLSGGRGPALTDTEIGELARIIANKVGTLK